MNPPKPKKSLCGYPFTACNSKSSHAKDCPMGEKVRRKKMVVASHRPSQHQQNNCNTKTRKRVVKIDNSFWKNNTSSASSYSLTEKDFDSIMKNMKRVVCEAQKIEEFFDFYVNEMRRFNFRRTLDFTSFRLGWECATWKVITHPQKTRGGK